VRSYQPPERPRALDYFQMTTSVLFVVAGAAIVYRALLAGVANPVAYLTGAGFAAYGVYRLRFVLRWYRRRGERHDA